MLCNGFRSALRPNSATAKGETEYSKVHNIEVQHAKYRITQYRNTLHNIQNTETQQIHYSIGSRSASRPNSATANGETVQYVFQMVEVEHIKYCNIHNVNFRHQMIYVQQQEIHQQCCSIATSSVVRPQ